MNDKWIDLISRNLPRSIILIIDTLVVVFNFIFSYFILSEFSFQFDVVKLLIQIPYIMLISLVSFLIVGSYKGVIRHTGVRDAISIYSSASLITVFLLTINYIDTKFYIYPNYILRLSNIIILFLMNLISLITTRYIFKNLYRTLVKSSVEKKSETSNILIYGAGEMGTIVYSILKKSNENNTKVIAFIDDDIKKQGNKIDRIEVVSMATITDDYVRSHKIKEVVLAINDIQQSRLIEISDQLLTYLLK